MPLVVEIVVNAFAVMASNSHRNVFILSNVLQDAHEFHASSIHGCSCVPV